MLSQKLQKDLMNAYAAVHEEKRGHASGDSDVEKQASQLASDVRYKAKGKVKPGTSDEEKKKVFLQILGASPAPSSVKAMARQKLLGEEIEQLDELSKKTLSSYGHKAFKSKKYFQKAKKVVGDSPYIDKKIDQRNKGMDLAIKKLNKEETEVKEGSMYGITKGDGMSFPERLKKKEKKKKEKMKMEE